MSPESIKLRQRWRGWGNLGIQRQGDRDRETEVAKWSLAQQRQSTRPGRDVVRDREERVIFS
jgi:hypothetical protein